ncbi:hypothetical protein KC678_04100 [Candidatus Dojkabacteria bacterium]|uniref:Uncharacterized protein n=1 Tax=Candidatus Dojkabacteria bacterium TaxID=2099670 RepID=A0A955L2B3_9BACT|nr:hypothetical protein [Candidatus Dojkabacteria bacterium]
METLIQTENPTIPAAILLPAFGYASDINSVSKNLNHQTILQLGDECTELTNMNNFTHLKDIPKQGEYDLVLSYFDVGYKDSSIMQLRSRIESLSERLNSTGKARLVVRGVIPRGQHLLSQRTELDSYIQSNNIMVTNFDNRPIPFDINRIAAESNLKITYKSGVSYKQARTILKGSYDFDTYAVCITLMHNMPEA